MRRGKLTLVMGSHKLYGYDGFTLTKNPLPTWFIKTLPTVSSWFCSLRPEVLQEIQGIAKSTNDDIQVDVVFLPDKFGPVYTKKIAERIDIVGVGSRLLPNSMSIPHYYDKFFTGDKELLVRIPDGVGEYTEFNPPTIDYEMLAHTQKFPPHKGTQI